MSPRDDTSPRRRLLRRPSPATVLSTLALFVALGGTGYAAVKLPARSVGNKQLKTSAVTSAKVRNGSLLSRDFKRGQLPEGGKNGSSGPRGSTGRTGKTGKTGRTGATGKAGATGKTGATGAKGATGGLSGTITRTREISVPPGAFATSWAACTTAERATGGGASFTAASAVGTVQGSLGGVAQRDAGGAATGATATGDGGSGTDAWVSSGVNTSGAAQAFVTSVVCTPKG